VMSLSPGSKYPNTFKCSKCKFSAIFYQIDPNYGVKFPFRT